MSAPPSIAQRKDEAYQEYKAFSVIRKRIDIQAEFEDEYDEKLRLLDILYGELETPTDELLTEFSAALKNVIAFLKEHKEVTDDPTEEMQLQLYGGGESQIVETYTTAKTNYDKSFTELTRIFPSFTNEAAQTLLFKLVLNKYTPTTEMRVFAIENGIEFDDFLVDVATLGKELQQCRKYQEGMIISTLRYFVWLIEQRTKDPRMVLPLAAAGMVQLFYTIAALVAYIGTKIDDEYIIYGMKFSEGVISQGAIYLYGVMYGSTRSPYKHVGGFVASMLYITLLHYLEVNPWLLSIFKHTFPLELFQPDVKKAVRLWALSGFDFFDLLGSTIDVSSKNVVKNFRDYDRQQRQQIEKMISYYNQYRQQFPDKGYLESIVAAASEVKNLDLNLIFPQFTLPDKSTDFNDVSTIIYFNKQYPEIEVLFMGNFNITTETWMAPVPRRGGVISPLLVSNENTNGLGGAIARYTFLSDKSYVSSIFSTFPFMALITWSVIPQSSWRVLLTASSLVTLMAVSVRMGSTIDYSGGISFGTEPGPIFNFIKWAVVSKSPIANASHSDGDPTERHHIEVNNDE